MLCMKRHSTSPPCGNLVDGLPHDCHTEPRSIGSARHPRTSVNFVVAFAFLINFYIMVTSFVLLILKISYWSLIFCEYQLPSSIKPWFPTRAQVFQNNEKMMKIGVRNPPGKRPQKKSSKSKISEAPGPQKTWFSLIGSSNFSMSTDPQKCPKSHPKWSP